MAITLIDLSGTLAGLTAPTSATITVEATHKLIDDSVTPPRTYWPEPRPATPDEDGLWEIEDLPATKGDAGVTPRGVTYKVTISAGSVTDQWEVELDAADGAAQDLADLPPVVGSVIYGYLAGQGDAVDIDVISSDSGRTFDVAPTAAFKGGYASVTARLAGIEAIPGGARLAATAAIAATSLTLRAAPEAELAEATLIVLDPFTASAEVRAISSIVGATVSWVAALARTHDADSSALLVSSPHIDSNWFAVGPTHADTSNRTAMANAMAGAATTGLPLLLNFIGTASVDIEAASPVLTVSSDLKIVGLDKERTILSFDGTPPASRIAISATGYMLTLEHLHLQGPASTNAQTVIGVQGVDGGGIYCQDVKFSRWSHGIKAAYDPAGPTAPLDVECYRCEFDACTEHGVLHSYNGTGTARAHFIDCYFHDLGIGGEGGPSGATSTTTTTAEVAGGAQIIPVAATTMFSVGHSVGFVRVNGGVQVAQVASISAGVSITITNTVGATGIASGATIAAPTWDANHDLYIVPPVDLFVFGCTFFQPGANSGASTAGMAGGIKHGGGLVARTARYSKIVNCVALFEGYNEGLPFISDTSLIVDLVELQNFTFKSHWRGVQLGHLGGVRLSGQFTVDTNVAPIDGRNLRNDIYLHDFVLQGAGGLIAVRGDSDNSAYWHIRNGTLRNAGIQQLTVAGGYGTCKLDVENIHFAGSTALTASCVHVQSGEATIQGSRFEHTVATPVSVRDAATRATISRNRFAGISGTVVSIQLDGVVFGEENEFTSGQPSCTSTNKARMHARRGLSPNSIASGTTVAPNWNYDAYHITGTGNIVNLNVVSTASMQAFNGRMYLIADGAWSLSNSGNIRPRITTARTADEVVCLQYDPVTALWYEVY